MGLLVRGSELDALLGPSPHLCLWYPMEIKEIWKLKCFSPLEGLSELTMAGSRGRTKKRAGTARGSALSRQHMGAGLWCQAALPKRWVALPADGCAALHPLPAAALVQLLVSIIHCLQWAVLSSFLASSARALLLIHCGLIANASQLCSGSLDPWVA